MVRAAIGHKNLAKVGKLSLKAFDLKTNDTAARERHGDDAGRRILRLEFDRQQIELLVLVRLIEIAALAAENTLETQRRAAPPVIRLARRSGVGGGDPVEAAESHHETMLARLPENVGHSHQGILQMRRHNFDVVAIERDESELINGPVHPRTLPGFACRKVRNGVA